ncbi:MAG: class I SAM-dependent methyltransferase [Betaproteobacteria bacterium]|nr:class I SAM-dependent methyltransferase [Betaproteobacteria bacterium]
MSTPAPEFTLRSAAPPAIPHAGRLLLSLLGRLDTGTLTFTAPDGTTTTFRGAHPGPVADLKFDDWDVATEAIRTAEIGLAECYRDGRLHTNDLTAFLMLCAANQAALEKVFYGKPLVALWLRFKHFLRSNTRTNSKKNIQAHYDLSNDFYAQWLDGTMSYSSALFEGDATRPMEQAQTAKYERILKVLDPQPGARILEIGCGWGGFAEHAASTRGVHVHGITLSSAQLAFARERMAKKGLDDRVTLEYIDYRDVRGEYDYIVSIEMFEAVGERYWPVYFKTVRDRLKPGGRAVIQAITIDEAAFPRYRATSDFIREYIFPGGMLAPVTRFIDDATAAGLEARAPHRFGLDYAATLAWWRERVDAASETIKPLGFDEKFLQLWRFYLSYCEAGFRAGRTDVMQIELAKCGQ